MYVPRPGWALAALGAGTAASLLFGLQSGRRRRALAHDGARLDDPAPPTRDAAEEEFELLRADRRAGSKGFCIRPRPSGRKACTETSAASVR